MKKVNFKATCNLSFASTFELCEHLRTTRCHHQPGRQGNIEEMVAVEGDECIGEIGDLSINNGKKNNRSSNIKLKFNIIVICN